jgi:FkbM family methyltransferase
VLIDVCAPAWQTVIDVGACIGDWSLRVLAANPAAEIHCFEPFPANVDALRKRMGERAYGALPDVSKA